MAEEKDYRNKSTPEITPLVSKPELAGYGPRTSWVIQPMTISTMYQSYELSQIRAMLTVIRQMQAPINAVINGADPKGQLELFRQNDYGYDNDLVGDGIVIEMKMKDITSDHSQYKAIREVLKKMQTLNVSYMYHNSDGRDSLVVEPFIRQFIIPMGKQRVHSIHVVLSPKIAEMIISTDGYSWHKILENVILESTNTSTQNLYMYLSAMRAKHKSREFDINTQELRRQAGTTKITYNDDNEIESEKVGYKQWGMFVKNVIDPAHDELKDKFDQKKSDMYFEWSPIYNPGRPRKGEPDAVHVTIFSIDDNLIVAPSSELNFDKVQSIMVDVFGIRVNNFATFKKQITSQQILDSFLVELERIDKSVKGDKRNAKYFYACAKDALAKLLQPKQVPVSQEQPESATDTVPGTSKSVSPQALCAKLIEELKLVYGNGQMGYDYYFGPRTACRVSTTQTIIIGLPKFGCELIEGSPVQMDRVRKCVEKVFGEGRKFMLAYM